MDDIISRQELLDFIDSMRELVENGRRMIRQADTLPSAQPEIVRCKDCLMHGVCRFEQGLGLDGFCSQAKRRTDG